MKILAINQFWLDVSVQVVSGIILFAAVPGVFYLFYASYRNAKLNLIKKNDYILPFSSMLEVHRPHFILFKDTNLYKYPEFTEERRVLIKSFDLLSDLFFNSSISLASSMQYLIVATGINDYNRIANILRNTLIIHKNDRFIDQTKIMIFSDLLWYFKIDNLYFDEQRDSRILFNKELSRTDSLLKRRIKIKFPRSKFSIGKNAFKRFAIRRMLRASSKKIRSTTTYKTNKKWHKNTTARFIHESLYEDKSKYFLDRKQKFKDEKFNLELSDKLLILSSIPCDYSSHYKFDDYAQQQTVSHQIIEDYSRLAVDKLSIICQDFMNGYTPLDNAYRKVCQLTYFESINRFLYFIRVPNRRIFSDIGSIKPKLLFFLDLIWLYHLLIEESTYKDLSIMEHKMNIGSWFLFKKRISIYFPGRKNFRKRLILRYLRLRGIQRAKKAKE